MLIKCIFNSGKDLPYDSRCLNESDETDYSFIKIGTEFIVYGLIFFPNRIDYLICLEGNNPTWIPANLFEIKDARLPMNWSICITSTNDNFKVLNESMNIKSIISYTDMVTSISHYTGVIERESEDLKVFFHEKDKIDDELSYV